MVDRTKVIVMVMILAQQLKVWLKHARDMGHMAREFKYLSGILMNALESFCKFLFKGAPNEDDEVYEHSVRMSDLIEELMTLEDDDIRRVMGLIHKIKKEHEDTSTKRALREESGRVVPAPKRS